MGCVIKIGNQSVSETDFLNHLNKIININKLFEENLDFSSKIYETLGFSKKLNFYKGDTLTIDEKIYSIVEKISSKELAKRNGLTISSNIPVYIVSEFLGSRKGGYDTVNNIIILSKDSDKETIHHELIHSVEYNLDKSELNPLYEKVKDSITEDSFDGFVSWNFKKNISEFVADALSKKVFRNALKKEGLLEEVDNVLSVYTSDTTPQQKQQAQQLYSSYLDTIFPDSKVKDIVYHGTSKDFNKFNKEPIWSLFEQLGSQVVSKEGIFFGKSQKHVKPFGNKIVFALLNIKNPLNWGKDINSNAKELNKLIGNKDAIYSVDTVAGENYPEVVVFEPEQIHILGSKQDIEGFKKFVEQPINKEIKTENFKNLLNLINNLQTEEVKEYGEVRQKLKNNKELLNFIVKYGNKQEQFLAKLFLDKVESGVDYFSDGVTVVIEKIDGVDFGGYYAHNEVVIKVPPFKTEGYEEQNEQFYVRDFIHKVLHEFAHYASREELNRNPKYKQEVAKLIEKAKQSGLIYDYGLTNEEEFVAETFSNSDFQKRLSEIPYNSTKSIFQKFIDLITSIIGKNIKNTLLEEALNVSIKIVGDYRYNRTQEQLIVEETKEDIINKLGEDPLTNCK